MKHKKQSTTVAVTTNGAHSAVSTEVDSTASATVLGEIERAHYVASDDMVRALARVYMQGERYLNAVRGSYLRILLSAVQREAKRQEVKRLGESTAVRLIDECHARLYAIVLEAVTTEEVASAPGLSKEEKRRRALERNRRSNFARSAKSTLVSWVRGGGRVIDLNAREVTKSELGSVRSDGESISLDEMIKRSTAALLRWVAELAKADRGEAARVVEGIRDELAIAVAKPVTVGRRVVRDITLHPE